jgi:hypothetical protein
MRGASTGVVLAVSAFACGTPSFAPAMPGGGAQLPDASSPSADNCIQARIAASAAVSNIVAQHAVGCDADGDCVLVATTLSCLENCESAILAARRADFRQELEDYQTAACPALPSNCGIAPSCAPLVGARCVNGICRPHVAATP